MMCYLRPFFNNQAPDFGQGLFCAICFDLRVMLSGYSIYGCNLWGFMAKTNNILVSLFVFIGLVLSGCSAYSAQKPIPLMVDEGKLNYEFAPNRHWFENCSDAADQLKRDKHSSFSEMSSESEKVLYISGEYNCNAENYIFAVDKNGLLRNVYRPKDKSINEPVLIDFDSQFMFLREKLRAKSQTGKRHKVLIFAHGGLVAHRNAVESANKMAPYLIADGYTPIFLVWNSDFASAYNDYLCCVTDGEATQTAIFSKSLTWSARLVGDIGGGISRAPELYVKQLGQYRRNNRESKTSEYSIWTDDIVRNCNVEYQGVEQGAIYFPEYSCEGIAKTFHRQSAWRPAEWGFHARLPSRLVTTSLSVGGESAWNNMVRRTRLAMANPDGASDYFSGSCEQRINVQNQPKLFIEQYNARPKNTRCRGGFAMLFSALEEGEKTGEFVNMDMTLAGHSMGAIVVNEVASSFAEISFDRIILMASAGSIRDFDSSVYRVYAHPRIQEKPEIYNLMLHPQRERIERFMGGLVAQGSLLEWIDEMFEGPRNLEEKTMGKYRNMKKFINRYSEQLGQDVKFRVFPYEDILNSNLCDKTDYATVENERCHPITHGEFNEYTFWRNAYLGNILPERIAAE